ncbi:Cof-type HAD-IIB family hydrolase [Heyndrickxia sporothermodurans]
MIRCIASDMDGTLLNSKQEISKKNREAIFFAKNHGVEVVIATGRSYEEAKFILEESDIICPIIAVNGAEIRNKNGEIVRTNGMSGATAASIAKVLNQLGIHFEIYTNKGKYTEDINESINIIVDIYKSANPDKTVGEIRSVVEEKFSTGLTHRLNDYNEIFSNSEYIIYKFVVFSRDRDLLTRANASLKALKEIKITSSGKNNLEINHIHAQKGIALKDFVEERGISLKETMAIGDNFNDLSMLKMAGHPVAMGNAESEIKEVVATHTSTNDEDGVGKAIYQLLNAQLKG